MSYSQVPGLAGLALPGDPIPWLIEPSNPCVRWRTLRELLGRPDGDSEVGESLEAVYRWPPVQRVLEMAADPAGYAWPAGIRAAQWARPGGDLAQLARVGVPPGRAELARAAAFLKEQIPDNRSSDCYQPQHVCALIRYGDPDDPGVIPLVNRVMANELMADGNRPPTGGGGTCCIGHSCHNAVARALDCVASVPEARRTPAMAAFLARGTSYLSAHRLYQKNHHGFAPIRSEYTRLRQPWALDWLTDVLDLLDVATRIGMTDSPALAPALRLLLQKQGTDGRWPLEAGYHTDRPLVANLLRDVEEVGKPGKWVTLTALLMLQRNARLVRRILAGEEFPEPVPDPAPAFTPYPWPYAAVDEAAVRSEWGSLDGMTTVLDGLVAFAERRGLEMGWYRGLAMGPAGCREWCCTRAKLVPARTIKAAFPVARTRFLAPRGLFTVDGLCARLGGGPRHEYSGRTRPGSWVEKTLWRVRVDRWTPCWDVVGVAVRSASELPVVTAVMAEALSGGAPSLDGPAGAP